MESTNHQATASLEIDLNEFAKDDLIHLITYAHARNITFNEAVVQILQAFIQYYEPKD